jgi:hypothetical protein
MWVCDPKERDGKGERGWYENSGEKSHIIRSYSNVKEKEYKS